MANSTRDLETLQDIKRMMERSSRFISLSGWSGIGAGLCALAGAFVAHNRIKSYYQSEYFATPGAMAHLKNDLVLIAAVTFIISFILASVFTFSKTRKEGVAIWGTTSKRLLWNTLLPLLAGGFLLWRMIDLKQYEFIAPASLIFYGLALVNGSKYTRGEVRWLGYGELLLGVINLWFFREELLFWSLGFGVLHIIYGVAMWWQYDRSEIISDVVMK